MHNTETREKFKRFLSIVPKENEFGIARGLDENSVPHDIELDFNEFAKVIGIDTQHVVETIEKKVEKKVEKVEQKVEQKVEEPKIVEKYIEQENVVIEETELAEPQQIVKEEEKPIADVQPKVEEQKPMSNADKLAAIKAKLAAINAQNKK